MSSVFKLFIVLAVGVFVTNVQADSAACGDCAARQDSSVSHREQIKADRAKYERENEKIVARPWDVIKNEGSSPDKAQ